MSRKLQLLAVAAAVASSLLAFGATPARATYPGENGNVLYASSTDGDSEIYFLAPNGGIGRLTKNKAVDVEPAYSAERDLAWASTAQPGGDLDIWVRFSGESELHRITGHPGQDTDPTWSPDGKRVVFATNRNGNYDLYVVDRDGKHLQQLISGPGDQFLPAWAPEGDRIAYVSNADGDDEIYVDDLNPATRPSKLTDNTFSDRRPSWSPSGERIVFTSDRYQANYNIYYMASTGDGQTRLTDDLALDSQPAYSPQGDRIAFVSERLGTPRLFTMDVSGGGEAALAGVPATAETPDWGRAAEIKQSVYAIKVDEHGTYATVSFKQARPTTTARVELWKPKKQQGAGVKLQVEKSDTPQTAWSIKVTHLEPATKYELHIVTPDAGGAIYEKVQPAVVRTLRRDVRLRLIELKLHDDSDPNGCGELAFDFDLGGSFARLTNDDMCDGDKMDLDVPIDVADVKTDTITLRALGVDNDESDYNPNCGVPNPLLPGFICILDKSGGAGPASYGALKDDGEWAEATFALGVGVLGFTPKGENYTHPATFKFKVKASSGGVRFTFRARLSVSHV